jgi:hypothetical protein
MPQKLEFSSDILDALNGLKAAGAVPKWGAEAPEARGGDAAAPASGPWSRRNVFAGELRQMGIKAPDAIARPSVRNDAAFLFSVTGALSMICR